MKYSDPKMVYSLLRAFWSLLDGIWAVLEGSSGVLESREPQEKTRNMKKQAGIFLLTPIIILLCSWGFLTLRSSPIRSV